MHVFLRFCSIPKVWVKRGIHTWDVSNGYFVCNVHPKHGGWKIPIYIVRIGDLQTKMGHLATD